MNAIIIKQQVELAIKNKKLLKIDYVDSKMQITRDRIVEPKDFRKTKESPFTIDGVYVQDLQKGFRFFSLEGIQKLEVIDDTRFVT